MYRPVNQFTYFDQFKSQKFVFLPTRRFDDFHFYVTTLITLVLYLCVYDVEHSEVVSHIIAEFVPRKNVQTVDNEHITISNTTTRIIKYVKFDKQNYTF